MQSKEGYHINVSSKFTAVKSADDNGDMKSAWKTINKNGTISARGSYRYQELKQYKLLFLIENISNLD
jgi:hypothetical protein